MAHPYGDKAKSSHNSKTKSMGKTGNLDIPVMRAVGENKSAKLYSSSSNTSQHQDQAKASGMKNGGRAYPLARGGGDSGVGRLEKAKSASRMLKAT